MSAPDYSSAPRFVSSGLAAFDEVLRGLLLGDNVVFQVDDLADYRAFVAPFLARARRDRRRIVYLRFAPHEPVATAADDPDGVIETVTLDPAPGFDYFSAAVHHAIEERGREVFYVFDNLSALVEEWATDELLGNFFRVTCPYLYELDTVTYFALTRGRHAHAAVAKIRDTTQVLVDVFRLDGVRYVHPLKVWDRFSPQMFLPHRADGERWQPLFQSGAAAAVTAAARQFPLRADAGAGAIAPWDSVYRKLEQCRTGGTCDETQPEIAALRQELNRMLLGAHGEFSRLADEYFTLDDLMAIRARVIGSGRIGGKAAGMLTARRILARNAPELAARLENHDSFFIGADVFFTFLVNNDLFRMRLRLARSGTMSHEEFAEVEQRFLAGKFPADILEQFRNLLDYFGQAPIIVRSSSLLEDSFGHAFAGKYRSEFCANQGDPEARLEAFLNAVKLVYASALNPDALSYRRKRGLGENDEQMAILVQRVSGMPWRDRFFPALAGVAFSRNLYAWNDRIDPRRGVIRLVFGLGTRAVNRVGDDYPRLIAVSHPQLRPEVGLKAAKYSQRAVDALDLRNNTLETVPMGDVLSPPDYPNLHLLVSTLNDGALQDPFTNRVESPPERLVLTFNNLLKQTPLVAQLGDMLSVLESAYGHPVDTEFTASLDSRGRVQINLLQCRPLWIPGATGPVAYPADLDPPDVLFHAARVVNGGVVENIRHIVLIDPLRYSLLPDGPVKRGLGRLVGRLTAHPALASAGVMMMGPGRWGSSNIALGVNVSYADIAGVAVLVEIAREEAGHVPEVSYGTHFFQDLVEDRIIYLPLYPDDPAAGFNQHFFDLAPNALPQLLPDAVEFSDWVQVIDVPAATGGRRACVVADPERQRAVCYLGGG